MRLVAEAPIAKIEARNREGLKEVRPKGKLMSSCLASLAAAGCEVRQQGQNTSAIAMHATKAALVHKILVSETRGIDVSCERFLDSTSPSLGVMDTTLPRMRFLSATTVSGMSGAQFSGRCLSLIIITTWLLPSSSPSLTMLGFLPGDLLPSFAQLQLVCKAFASVLSTPGVQVHLQVAHD